MLVKGLNASEIESRIDSGEIAKPTLNEDKAEQDDEEEETTLIRGDKKQTILQLAFEHPEWDYTHIAEEADSSEGHARSIIKSLHDGEYGPVELSVVLSGMTHDEIKTTLDSGDIASYTKVSDDVVSTADEESEESKTEDASEEDEELSFAESFRQAVEQDDLRRFTIAELRSNINSIDDLELVVRAQNLDSRSTAIAEYEKREEKLRDADDGPTVTWTEAEHEQVEEDSVDETPETAEAEEEADTESVTETPAEASPQVDAELAEAVEEFREVFERRLEEAEEEAEMLEHGDFAKGKAKMAELGLELLPAELLGEQSA
jgi:hypothetical protein